MRKLLLLIGIIAIFICRPNSLTAQPDGIQVTESTPARLKIHFETKGFAMSTLNYKGEEMQVFSMAGFVLPAEKGTPNVPCISSFVAVPHGAKVSVNLIGMENETFENVNLAPSLGISSDLEKSNADYEKDARIYATNAFFPSQNVEVSEPFALRGVDVVALNLSPVRYNPITKQLQVCRSMELELSFEGGGGFGDDRLRSPYWDPILERNILNYNLLPKIDYAVRMKRWLNEKSTGCEYLIIVPNNEEYVAIANQLKNFRMKQGILTEVLRLDEMGVSSADELGAWIYDVAWAWDIPPVAICLAADHGTDLSCNIPSKYVSHPEIGQCVSDNFYSDMNGDDLPDICVSRLPASTANELAMMVEKQIDYEQNPNTEHSFYHNPLTACCWQTSSWFQLCAEIVGGYWRKQGKEPVRVNEILEGTPDEVWSSAAYNTPTIVSYFGPEGQGYLPAHPSELGGWTGGTDAQIINAINAGAFMALHRDHGYETGWEMPHFDNGSVSVLDNHGRLPFVMSINCSTGRFDFGSDCLMEALLKHTKDGATAGAVGAIAPTGPSYTFVNDLLTWGMFDFFDPDFMPDVEHYSDHVGDCFPAFGNVAGKYFLARNSWVSHHGKKAITYRMFTSFCDAFLRVNTEVPQAMNIAHYPNLYEGSDMFWIDAQKDADIALSVEHEDGDVELFCVEKSEGVPFYMEVPLFPLGTKVDLVVTAQNRIRYEKRLEVVKSSEAMLAVESIVQQPNLLNAGENGSFDITVRNIGGQTSQNGQISLFVNSDCLSVDNPVISLPPINPDETVVLENAFEFRVPDSVSDGTVVDLLLSYIFGNYYGEQHFSKVVNAPVVSLGGVTVEETEGDGDGLFEAGETGMMLIDVKNEGSGRGNNVKVWVEVLGDYVSAFDTVCMQHIEPYHDTIVSLPIMASDTVKNGLVFYSYVHCEATPNDSGWFKELFCAPIGRQPVADFESGSVDETYWNLCMSSNACWEVDDIEPFEGNYCLRSGYLGDGVTQTELRYAAPAGVADSITFYYRIAGHASTSFEFWISNHKQLVMNVPCGWTRASFPIQQGGYLRWVYKKYYAQEYEGDYVALDFISLPPEQFFMYSAGPDIHVCPNENAYLIDNYAFGNAMVRWTVVEGNGIVSTSNDLHPTYIPSNDDIERGYVRLRMNSYPYFITDDYNYFYDEMTIYFDAPEIDYVPQPEGETEILLDSTLIGQYSVPPVENAVSYEWFLSPAEAGEIIGHGTEATVKWNRFAFATDAEVWVRAYTRCGDYAESLPLPVGVTLCVDENTVMEGLTVYPNPATDVFRVVAHDVDGRQAVLSVYNAVGQRMMMQKATISDRTAQFRFSSEALPSGLYLIVLQTDETIRTGKLIHGSLY